MRPFLAWGCLRLALIGLTLLGSARCTAATPSPPDATRWAVIGDRSVGPDRSTLRRWIAASSGRDGRTPIADFSEPGAGLEDVLRRQLGLLLGVDADVVIVKLGSAAADTQADAERERFADRLTALLAVLTARPRVRVLVNTIAPPSVDAPADRRLDMVRRLRRVHQDNEAIRLIARQHGAVLVDAAAGALDRWREAVQVSTSPAAIIAADDEPPLASWLADMGDTSLRTLRQRADAARAAGRWPDVVAKVGDSITASPAFLTTVAADAAAPQDLNATIAYFTRRPIVSAQGEGAEQPPAAQAARATDPDRGGGADQALGDAAGTVATSFTRQSAAARAEWAAADVLAGGSASPLARELADSRAGVVVVMFGTNDLTRHTVEEFEAAMDRLLTELADASVIAVLNTIPARMDRADFARRVPAFNAALRALATVHAVPLIEYGAAMSRLPNGGLDADGIHPSVCPDGPGIVTPACLAYGANLRNRLTLAALDALRRLVLEPDAGTATSEAEAARAP